MKLKPTYFIVTFGCLMDDFIIRMFKTFDTAYKFSRSLKAEVPKRIQELYGIDASEVVCIKIIGMTKSKHGFIPTFIKFAKDFDE